MPVRIGIGKSVVLEMDRNPAAPQFGGPPVVSDCPCTTGKCLKTSDNQKFCTSDGKQFCVQF